MDKELENLISLLKGSSARIKELSLGHWKNCI